MSGHDPQAGEEPQPCDLCGLPLGAQPWVLQTSTRDYAFCCEGCLGIYQMLHEVEADTVLAPPAGRPR